jgi:uncharacterized protein (TIGR02118 family)
MVSDRLRRKGIDVKQILALYGHPDDPAAFDRHYVTTHAELVRRMPRLRAFRYGKVEQPVGTDPAPYYLVAEMTYDSQSDLDASLNSPEGRAAVDDLRNFTDAVTLLTVDLAESGLGGLFGRTRGATRASVTCAFDHALPWSNAHSTYWGPPAEQRTHPYI